MTKSEIMKMAHVEARKFRIGRTRAWQPVSYAYALSVGLRRAHNAAQKAAYLAIPREPTPKFMFLRGL